MNIIESFLSLFPQKNINNAIKKINIKNNINLYNSIKIGLANEEFYFCYQPQVNIKTSKIVGVEALIRWKKNGKIIPPSHYINFAEDVDIIEDITIYALNKVAMQINEWLADDICPDIVSVNIPIKLINEDILETLLKIKKKYSLPDHILELELTENSFINVSMKNFKSILIKIHDLGFLVSIDDFGTGYSSLEYLSQLPIQKFKLDRIFVSDIIENENSMKIITYLSDMLKSCNKKIVIEGVETVEQKNKLLGINSFIVQGYFYYKPLTVTVLNKLLKENLNGKRL